VSSNDIPRDQTLKKEARGIGDDADFGEVQDISREYVITQKGIVDKILYSKEFARAI
jgi:hypothetical protein